MSKTLSFLEWPELFPDDRVAEEWFTKNHWPNGQVLQSTLKANPLPYKDRKELYRIGLDSCLSG